MRKTFIGGVAACIATFVVAGSVAPVAQAAPIPVPPPIPVVSAKDFKSIAPITIRFASYSPSTSGYAASMNAANVKLQAMTGGKVKYEFFWAGSLIPTTQILQGIAAGTADMGTPVYSVHPTQLPIANWMSRFGALANPSIQGGLAGRATTTQIQRTQRVLQDEFSANGVRWVAPFAIDSGFFLFCNKEITTPAEMAGKRIRTVGAAYNDPIKALGAVPVTMPVLDVYQALSRGTIDCAIGSANTAIDYGWWEVAKFTIPTKFIGAAANTAVVVNKGTWDAWPKAVKQAIYSSLLQSQRVEDQSYFDGFKRFATEGVDKKGIKFIDPRPFDAVIDASHRQMIASLPASAPATLANPQALIDAYSKDLRYWNAVAAQTVGKPVPRDAENVRKSLIAAKTLGLNAFYRYEDPLYTVKK